MAFNNCDAKAVWAAWLGPTPKRVWTATFLRRNSTSRSAFDSSLSRTLKYVVSAGLPKDKNNYSSFNFFGWKLRKISLDWPVWCGSRGINNFSLSQLFGKYGNGNLSITWVEICNFSRAGRKTENLPRSKLFLSMAFKHGLQEGSTFIFQYSSMTRAPLESYRLGELKDAISRG